MLLLAATSLAATGAQGADQISHPIARFSGLDKITARVTGFDVYLNETVQFGALQITPRACHTAPAGQRQRTAAFVEVDQVSLKGTLKRIFTGWMFAQSPALNAVDNAVYDVWLTACKQTSNVPPPSRQAITTDAEGADLDASQ